MVPPLPNFSTARTHSRTGTITPLTRPGTALPRVMRQRAAGLATPGYEQRFPGRADARDPLFRRSFRAQRWPARAQVRGRQGCPRLPADYRSFPSVLARMWHASARFALPCLGDPSLVRHAQAVGRCRSPGLAVTVRPSGSARVGSCCGQPWWSAITDLASSSRTSGAAGRLSAVPANAGRGR